MTKQQITLLLVEDNPGDARLTQEALKDINHRMKVQHVNDGVEALAFLQKEEPYANVPRPDLILLDLNMPRMNGLELLEKVKGDKSLKQIPVLILTISEAEEDISGAYDLNANCYINKPVDFGQFTDIAEAIETFWFTVVTLP
jgi:two-component system response regulator